MRIPTPTGYGPVGRAGLHGADRRDRQGEGDQPPHPQAKDLAALLIERGADPFDPQALYNTSITRDDTDWLDILWTQSERHGRLGAWRAVPGGLGPRRKCPAERARLPARQRDSGQWFWAGGLAAGARHGPQRCTTVIPGAPSARRRLSMATSRGMAELLERFGARRTTLEGSSTFRAACMSLDREVARAVAANHPEYLRGPEPMLTAARAGRADTVALLLELGVDVDLVDGTEQRALQVAVKGGSLKVIKLLVAPWCQCRPTHDELRRGDGLCRTFQPAPRSRPFCRH